MPASCAGEIKTSAIGSQSARANQENSTYSFTLLLNGIDEITSELEDALYGGACNDALISQAGGRVYLDFDRAAESWSAAIMSAIEDVENSGLGVRVARVYLPGEEVIEGINAFLHVRDQPDLRRRLTP